MACVVPAIALLIRELDPVAPYVGRLLRDAPAPLREPATVSAIARWMIEIGSAAAGRDAAALGIALHQGVMCGAPYNAKAWREARRKAVAETDARESLVGRAEGALVEALMWPPGSTGVLVDGLAALAELSAAREARAAGWDERQAAKADAILEDLVARHGGGCHIPALFASSAPALEAAYLASRVREAETDRLTRVRVAAEVTRLAQTARVA